MTTETSRPNPTMPGATWFLWSDEGKPLGQQMRLMTEMTPAAGQRFTVASLGKQAEVVRFEELTQSCGLRRFKVTVQVLA